MLVSKQRNSINLLLRMSGVAIAYALLGRLALLLAIPPGYAIAVYPPAGIALGMLVARGIRLIPGVLVGAFVVNLSIAYENTGALHTSNVIAALLIALGAAIQAGIGSSLIRHFLEDDVSLDVDHRVLKFFFLGGIVACCVSPTVGVFSLYSLQLIPATAVFHNWLTWWVGDTLGVFTITPIVMVLFARPRNIWFSRRWNVMLPLLCCLAIVIATFIFVRHREEQKQQLEFRLEAERISQNLQVTLNNHLDAVKNMERFFAASTEVTRADFQIFVAHAIENHPAITALLWAPNIPHGQRRQFETQVQAEGFPHFRITENSIDNALLPASVREDYFPINFLFPFSANNPSFGYDMGSSMVRRIAIEDARDSGEITVTDPLVLLYDQTNRRSILLYAPVYRRGLPLNSIEQRRAAFLGVVVSVLQMEKVLHAAFEAEDTHDVLLKFYDLSSPGKSGTFFDNLNVNDYQHRFQASVNFGGRQYALIAQASAEYWKNHDAIIIWITIIAGLLFSSLLCIYLLMTSAHTFNVENLIKKRTLELRESEERLKTIFNSAAEGIITTDADGVIDSANVSSAKLFGSESNRIIGRNIYHLFPDQHSGLFLDQCMHTAQISGRNEVRGLRTDGEQVSIELAVTRVQDGGKTLYVMLLHDISEMKRVEKLKNEFVSAVSHELRTPLTSIRGVLSLMVGGLGGTVSEKSAGLLAMANDNAIRLSKLINDLLDFEKLEYGGLEFDLQPMSLHQQIEQSVQANLGYAQGFSVEIQYAHPADEPIIVMIDAGRFIQVLSNLLSNAIKFSSEHSYVEVRTRRLQDSVRIEVEDHGIGISDEFKPRIFQKFSQEDAKAARKYAGTGLGLSLSKTMIERMGGGIGFSSTLGQGSIFYIELPLFNLVASTADETPSTTLG